MLLVLAVLLAGCKVDARVDVRMKADGSGTVTAQITLDDEAVGRVTAGGASLDKAVRLDDMRAAGWTISSWETRAGGSTITLTHKFTGQQDLARRLEDLGGVNGVFRDPKIRRTSSFFGANQEIEVNVDLRNLSTGIRSDGEVATALTNAGVNVDALDAQLNGELGKSVTFTIGVVAPGGETSATEVKPGTVATAGASSSQVYAKRIALLAIGAAFLALAIALTGASLVAGSRRRRASSASIG